MNRNRRIFIIIFIAFVLIVVLITIDMARRTTAPWNRRKQLERALPGQTLPPPADGITIDTTGLDTLR
ncbi:hypothetical protein F5984_01935 [Rudanella paleaurantiibacter]|uniref:Uncharacterized protein n=1 Tax=Rudanella paleaurantiibacter TaxID=2614655 RepID=A0A7J5U4G4_9BACT|nr:MULTISPECIES: hypothetical protein [Rudanella]KAB7732734.1 hypothetical protein F5984_01935 [Rudanella paleaurantiibacter]